MAEPPLTQRQLIDLREAAFRDAQSWFGRKMERGILADGPAALLGPTFDQGTYYYRMGADPSLLGIIQLGWGFDAAQLKRHRDGLIARGVPEVNPYEVGRINSLAFAELNRIRPNRNLVAKHFPGGTEFLETTEKNLVHFGTNYPIANWISAFNEPISGKKPAWGMMLSHASYDLHAFPGIENMRPPNIPDYITDAVRRVYNIPASASQQEVFNRVPASMNPYVSDYLRGVKGYKGVVIGDWYNMSGATEFLDRLDVSGLTKGKSEPNSYDKAFLLAVNAGVNYVRPISYGVMTPAFWDDFKAQSPEKYKAFEDKINEVILNTYNTIKKPNDPVRTVDDIAKLSFQNRVELISSTPAGGPAAEIDKPKYKTDLAAAAAAYPDKNLYDVINVRNQLVANDVWDRGSVVTMMFRKSLVERIANKKFPDAPMDKDKELKWHEDLMADKAFRATYDKIPWDKVLTDTTPDASRARNFDVLRQYPPGGVPPALPSLPTDIRTSPPAAVPPAADAQPAVPQAAVPPAVVPPAVDTPAAAPPAVPPAAVPPAAVPKKPAAQLSPP